MVDERRVLLSLYLYFVAQYNFLLLLLLLLLLVQNKLDIYTNVGTNNNINYMMCYATMGVSEYLA